MFRDQYKLGEIYEKKELLDFAYQSTEFYHRKYDDCDLNTQWDDLPITTKREVAHAGVSILSAKYFSKVDTSDIINVFTSGSTGESLEHITTKQEQAKSLLSLWLYRKKYYNIDMNAKFCYFFTIRDYLGQTKCEHRGNGLGFSKELLQEENLEMLYDEMYQFQPEWLLLQPSIAMIFARYIFESGVEPIGSLRYIELTGEMVSKQQITFISRAFEVKVASQYGCNEIGTIAYQCPFGHFHVMNHNVYVDIVPRTEQDRKLGSDK